MLKCDYLKKKILGFYCTLRSGTISSGPPSVDHRVEELVLELNESDQKIQEQEVCNFSCRLLTYGASLCLNKVTTVPY